MNLNKINNSEEKLNELLDVKKLSELLEQMSLLSQCNELFDKFINKKVIY